MKPRLLLLLQNADENLISHHDGYEFFDAIIPSQRFELRFKTAYNKFLPFRNVSSFPIKGGIVQMLRDFSPHAVVVFGRATYFVVERALKELTKPPRKVILLPELAHLTLSFT
jgi:hypothetical protein